jgi:hypothetical protein
MPGASTMLSQESHIQRCGKMVIRYGDGIHHHNTITARNLTGSHSHEVMRNGLLKSLVPSGSLDEIDTILLGD